MSDYGDKESILKSNLIKPDKSKIAHQKNTVCLGGPCMAFKKWPLTLFVNSKNVLIDTK